MAANLRRWARDAVGANRHAPGVGHPEFVDAGWPQMKNLFKSVRMAFRAPRGPASPMPDASERAIARRVVRTTSTGNVRLQRGQYVMREDVDREYERVKSYNFRDA